MMSDPSVYFSPEFIRDFKDLSRKYDNFPEDFDRMLGKGITSTDVLGGFSGMGGAGAMPSFGGFFLDGKCIYDKQRDLIIAGLGGSMLYNGGESQYTESQMKWRIKRLAPRLMYNRKRYGRALDILVTHAPPKGMGDGEDLCHKGFCCFLDFIKTYRPKYLLHGHVHLDDANAPRVSEYCGTKVINIYKNYIIEDESLGGHNA